MEKIVVVGPFNDAMKAALNKNLADTFKLEYIGSRDEYSALRDADYTILRTLNFTAEDIAAMERVRLIQRWGAGFDTVDIDSAAKRGIPVAVTYGINSTPVAEMALALTLAVYRHLASATSGILAGKWERDKYGRASYTIQGKTVGIVGMGNIGRKTAELFKAFGAQVIYFDAYRMSGEKEKAAGVEFCELEELWSRCDIISIHAPLTEGTAGMVNAEAIDRMKNGAVLINTAREELVDLPALAAALKSGKLLGAGLDAIDEKIINDNPFAGLDNVVLSPHLGGNTADNVEFTAKRCAEQIRAISRGEKLMPPHVVNGVR